MLLVYFTTKLNGTSLGLMIGAKWSKGHAMTLFKLQILYKRSEENKGMHIYISHLFYTYQSFP